MRKLGSRVGSALPFLAGLARPPASPQQRGTVHAAAPAADAPERPPPAEARRLTLLLVGPAGKGKSTLGNLLVLGRAPDGSPGELPFDTSEEFDSVGVDIAHADFEFGGVPCRVIDAPGTDGGACDVAEKLAKCAEGEKPLAPGGVDVFVFVMQKGRFTEDLAGQLLALEDAAGPDSRAHGRRLHALRHGDHPGAAAAARPEPCGPGHGEAVPRRRRRGQPGAQPR